MSKKRKTSERFDFESPIPVKKKLKHVFGSYHTEISEEMVEYMHRNPKQILNRFYKIYGDKAIMYMINDAI